MGEDGFYLLDQLEAQTISTEWRELPIVETLRQVLTRHYDRLQRTREGKVVNQVRFKENRELDRAAESIESPYDPDARYRTRYGTGWVGYIVHLTETCEEAEVHLITHVATTEATVHEVQNTKAIHQALVDKQLPPGEHLVDSAYIDADLLVDSQQTHAISLIGPTRPNSSWQAKLEGGYDIEQFEIDWARQQVRCPQGNLSSRWKPSTDSSGSPVIYAWFRPRDCQACPARELCTKAKSRRLSFRPQAQYEALQDARQRLDTEEGQLLYNRRAGIEGTLSQGVRAFGLRLCRYRGLAKTHLQHIATAAAINIDRIIAWVDHIPRAKTRQSAFANWD